MLYIFCYVTFRFEFGKFAVDSHLIKCLLTCMTVLCKDARKRNAIFYQKVNLTFEAQ